MKKKKLLGIIIILSTLVVIGSWGSKEVIRWQAEKLSKPLKVEKKDGRESMPDNKTEQVLASRGDGKEVRPDYSSEMLAGIVQKYVANSGYEIYIGLYDFRRGKYLGYKDEELFYPASLTKAIYLAVLFKQEREGRINLDEKYVLKDEDKYVSGTAVGGAGILQYAEPGKVYSYRELAYLMITASDNVAANIVLDRIGIEEVNGYCQEIGLKNTSIYRKYYELGGDKPFNRTTARDLTWFLVKVAEDAIRGDKGAGEIIRIMQANPDKRIGKYISHSFKTANKTGTVEKMAGDMALIYREGKPVLAVTVIVKGKGQEAVEMREGEEIIGRIAEELLKM